MFQWKEKKTLKHCLLNGLFHPPSQKDQYFFDNIDKALDVYSTYEKVILGGDLDSQIGENR